MKGFIAAKAQRVGDFGVAIAFFALAAICTNANAAQYVPDPTWIGGLIGADNFASSFDIRRGQKVAQGDNGDVIVAGVVPAAGSAAGHMKIGLVHYNHAGVRQAWSNAGANGYFGNQYVIAPCDSAGWCGDVKDVKSIYRFGNRVYVLADTESFLIRPVGNPPVPQVYAAPAIEVYVFGIDGSLQSVTTVDADAYANDDSRTVYGGGIAVYSNLLLPETLTLVYAGTGIVDGVYRPRYARYKVESSGVLTSLTDVMEPAFGSVCSAGHYCQLSGIATGGRAIGSSVPRIYISGSSWHPGPDPGTIGWAAGWDAFAASVNATGTPATSFATNGIYTTEGIGTQSGGQKVAVSGGFGASVNDDVFLLADVELACRNGIAILKLAGDGTRANTFGSNGQVSYGGSNETNASACGQGWFFRTIRADYPTDIVYSGGLLGVAGLNIYGSGTICIVGQPCPEDNVDGEVAVIDPNTGAINSWRGYAYADTADGARSRHSGFWGISSAGDGTFTVGGDVRYFETAPADRRGKQMFATLRVAPFSDSIFKNGFEPNAP
ncbi:MAG: hypothetical protein ABIO49_02675 [Dokdonella sp.]